MVINKSDLVSQMEKDLQIQTYDDESLESYYARLIYSALADWMRYCLFDETINDNEDGEKSMKYVLNRGIEILDLYLSIFPECKKYFEDKERNLEKNSVINLIRENMLNSGELVKNRKNHIQILDHKYKKYIGKGLNRLYGISTIRNRYYVGIAQVQITGQDDGMQEDIEDPIELLKWIKKGNWQRIDNLDDLDFFNPFLKKAPHQCWGEFHKNTNIENFWLVRYRAKDGILYGILRKKSNIYDVIWMNEYLIKWKEERRLIFAFRFLAHNRTIAKIQKRGNAIILNLGAGLPIKEEILVRTYCWPYQNIYSKTNYVIPQIMWNYYKDIITRLRIEIIES